MTSTKPLGKYQYQQDMGSHPYAHRLRMKPTTSYIQSFAPERSLTVTNFQITPRTSFEMERPQTQGSPRLVVINTSFRTFSYRNLPRKRVPTFPKLATDPSLNRRNNVSRQTSSSFTTGSFKPSMPSGHCRESGSAICTLGSPNNGPEREHSSRSNNRRGQQRSQLTQRQTSTFAAYAKYNDIVNSTKAKEKASESPITTNNNDLSALIPEKRYMDQELNLTNEKHMWISDWVASTSAALRLDPWTNDNVKANKTLSIIQEL